MAEDLTRGRTSAPEPVPLPSPSPPAEPHAPAWPTEAPLVEAPVVRGRRQLYRGRFLVAYAVLTLGAAAAAAATVLLIDRAPERRVAAWSTWQPTGRESSYPRQIADHVSRAYRLPSGNQLVAVSRAGAAEVPVGDDHFPLAAAVIQNDPGDVAVVQLDDDVLYVLCGGGPQCTIAEGRPSIARGRLLRREALEMALYTFKYTDADNVIMLLPPRISLDASGEAETITSALFFQKNDFQRQLDLPHEATFTRATPPLAHEIPPAEAARIDALTEHHVYRYQITQAQDGSAIILLVPFTA